jgi:hypothetical protein
VTKLFQCYTDRQAAAIRQALLKEGLKREADADWPQILEAITESMQELSEENADADKGRYPGVAARRYAALMGALSATLLAYDKLGMRLQSRLETQLSHVPPLREKDSELLTTLQRLLSSSQFPRALNAIQLAADLASKTPSHFENIQTTGRPKNYVMRNAVAQLLGAFEDFTGRSPIVYFSELKKCRYSGNFYKFAVACLSPVGLVPRKRLGSAILAAYRERR